MLKLFKQKQVDPRVEMQAVLGEYELPSFPAIIMNALEKVRDENTSQSEIAELVSVDPGLSAHLLKTVNSAAYFLNHKVINIDHAVSLMGRGELESIMITLAVSKLLPARNVPFLDMPGFWHVAARRAVIARNLANLVDPSHRSECFTAALLQDMAIPVLAGQRTEDYAPVLQAWRQGNEDLATLEREKFDWDHAMVAMWMCEIWDFPECITHAIGTHHGTGETDLDSLPVVNHVALLQVDEPSGVEELIEAVHATYGLPLDQVTEMVNSSIAAAEEIARMLV